MPNWVANTVRMENMMQLPLFVETNDTGCYFDFNKIIPCPSELDKFYKNHREYSSYHANDAFLYAITEKCTVSLDKLPQEKQNLLDKVFPQDNNFVKDYKYTCMASLEKNLNSNNKTTMQYMNKLYPHGMELIRLVKVYGAINTHDWCVRNWGTKWNSTQTYFLNDDKNIIEFQTAWSMPMPIMIRLSEMYPDAIIEHWWADEDYGHNSGHYVYQNGEAIGGYDEPCSDESIKHYNFCWHEDVEQPAE